MKKNSSLRFRLPEFWGLLAGLSVHLAYLFRTTFVDWPEMLLYPWFASQGLVYYRDVSVPFPPLINYFLSASYGILGFSPESERIIAYILVLLTDILIYWIVRTVTQNRLAAWGSLCFFVFWHPIFYGNSLWHETVIAPVMLGTLFAVLRYIRVQDNRSVMMLALFVTALSLMKQTVVWPLIAVAGYLFFSSQKKSSVLRHGAIALCTMAAAHLLVLGWYAFRGAGNEYLFWVYKFPLSLGSISSQYGIPVTRSDLALLLPAFLPLMVLPIFGKSRIPYLLMIPWTVALFLMALPRWGIFRLEPALAFAAIAFGLFLTAIYQKLSRLRLAVWVGVIVLLIGFGWRSFWTYVTLRDPMQPQFFGKQYTELLSYAREHVDGPLYILGNYDYLYFGLHSAPVVRPWIPMFPWNGQIPGSQASIINAIRETKVPTIWYIPYHGWSGFYGSYFPAAVYTYILNNYSPAGYLPVPGGVQFRLSTK